MTTGDIISLEHRAQAREWLKTLIAALQRYSFNYTNESELQQGLASVFETLTEPFEAEYRLSEKDRIDFYWPNQRVGVEVKIDHSLSDLTRQVHRYVQHEEIQGVLVVTGKVRLAALPEAMNNKPIFCHSLIGSLL